MTLKGFRIEALLFLWICFFFVVFFFNENTKLVFSHTHLVWDKFAVREQHHWTDCCITEGLLKSHIRLKHEDKHDQRGAHGIDFKGSFTSQSYIWIPRPDVSWLFMLFFVKCKSLYKYPASFFFFFFNFFSFWYFCVSFAISAEGFCYSFNHPSTSLFSFVSFNLFTRTERQNISSLLSGCNDDLTECWLHGQIQTTNQTILEGEGASKHETWPAGGNQINAGEHLFLLCEWSTDHSGSC